MLDWCLTHSMRKDGSFVFDEHFYNSLESCHYFGVSFLDEVGYFRPRKRFWTDRKFPEASRVQHHVIARLNEFCPQNPSVIAAKWKAGTDLNLAAKQPVSAAETEHLSRRQRHKFLVSADTSASSFKND